jgi:SAM-dependent methyltransferase
LIKACKAKSEGIKNLEFRVMDVLKRMDFEDESFDIITCMFSPYNPREVYRLLKREGVFLLLWGLKGDHKEITELFPEIFKLWKGKLVFDTIEERRKRLSSAKLEVICNVTLEYKWIFKDVDALKEFYEKIFQVPLFKGKKAAG